MVYGDDIVCIGPCPLCIFLDYKAALLSGVAMAFIPWIRDTIVIELRLCTIDIFEFNISTVPTCGCCYGGRHIKKYPRCYAKDYYQAHYSGVCLAKRGAPIYLYHIGSYLYPRCYHDRLWKFNIHVRYHGFRGWSMDMDPTYLCTMQTFITGIRYTHGSYRPSCTSACGLYLYPAVPMAMGFS